MQTVRTGFFCPDYSGKFLTPNAYFVKKKLTRHRRKTGNKGLRIKKQKNFQTGRCLKLLKSLRARKKETTASAKQRNEKCLNTRPTLSMQYQDNRLQKQLAAKMRHLSGAQKLCSKKKNCYLLSLKLPSKWCISLHVVHCPMWSSMVLMTFDKMGDNVAMCTLATLNLIFS